MPSARPGRRRVESWGDYETEGSLAERLLRRVHGLPPFAGEEFFRQAGELGVLQLAFLIELDLQLGALAALVMLPAGQERLLTHPTSSPTLLVVAREKRPSVTGNQEKRTGFSGLPAAQWRGPPWPRHARWPR